MKSCVISKRKEYGNIYLTLKRPFTKVNFHFPNEITQRICMCVCKSTGIKLLKNRYSPRYISHFIQTLCKI